ncbi:Rad9-domain-containing protein [Hygrophoropsis aurantiaca]|uniref:Rad9-domain-containing protein n=1 Tax=Hygrophoropsis aurantiaca TaxID=72124 RepID=A0ACB8A8J2_9AGAM|nr:Rad9-domain-containing protein [Hygrophoropsis aurantiaca]
MQGTLNGVALKPFLRALACLSKYGDDLVIHADQNYFSLSATNSSLSAYCRFKYSKRFFSRYKVGSADGTDESRDSQDVKGQLLTKNLLSILKHYSSEKSVERCELSIVEGVLSTDQEGPNEDQDTLESRLIVRLHCKHGIIKTHRLPLLIPTSLLIPGIPDSFNESRLTIGPRTIKDITEHFQGGRGPKSDPQLVWTFRETDVEVKSLESSIDSRGSAQLSTELTISADEFDVYDVFQTPITIAFHLREFNATVAYAESMSLTIDLRFTDPAAPLFVDVEGDESESLFVVSTSQIHGPQPAAPSNTPSNVNGNNSRKRPYNSEEESMSRTRSETPRTEKVKKSMKAVSRAESLDPGSHDSRSMPPPSLIPRQQSRTSNASQSSQSREIGRAAPEDKLFLPQSSPPMQNDASVSASFTKDATPLFFPLSQLSQADAAVIRSSGLGLESMNSEELHALLEGEGEEVAFDLGSQKVNAEEMNCNVADDNLEIIDDTQFSPTQNEDGEGRKVSVQKFLSRIMLSY